MTCHNINLLACRDQLVLLIDAMDSLNILSPNEARHILPPVSRTAWLGLISFLERRLHSHEWGAASTAIPLSETRVARHLIAVLRRCIAGLPGDPTRETLQRRWTQDFCHLPPADQLSTLLVEMEALGVLSNQEVQQTRPPPSGIGWLQLLGCLNMKLDMWEYRDGMPVERGRDSEWARHALALMTTERAALYGSS